MKLDELKKEIFSRNPPSIKTKPECYLLFESGFFGNKIETANSYKEILEKKWTGTISMRSRKKRIDRTRVLYNLPIENIPYEIKKFQEIGISEEEISFSRTPPDNKLLFQGEIMNSLQGLHLVYSELKKPMNIALKEEEKILTGLLALNFLKHNLSPASLDDVRDLLKMFPNDVIEFSCYEIEVGTLINRNVIIWEVRGY